MLAGVGEFSIKLLGSLAVGGMGFFGAVKITKLKSTSAPSYLRGKPPASLVKTNAFKPLLVISTYSGICHILAYCCEAKVFNCVIGYIPINMVNYRISRPKMVSVYKPMGVIPRPKELYHGPAACAQLSGSLSGVDSVGFA